MKLRPCVMTPPTSGSETQQETEFIPRASPERLDWLRQSLRNWRTPAQRDFIFSKVTEAEFWEPMQVPQLGVNVILNHIEAFSEEQQKLLKDRSRYPMRLLAGARSTSRAPSVTGSEKSRETRRRKVHRIGSLVSSGGYITVGSSRRVHTGSKEERSRGRALKRKVREQQIQKKAEVASKAPKTTEGSVKSSVEAEGMSTPVNVDDDEPAESVVRSPVGSPSLEVDYSVDSPVLVCPTVPRDEKSVDPPPVEEKDCENSTEMADAPPGDEDPREVISEKKRAVLAKKQELLQKQIDLQKLILRRRRESSPLAHAVQPRPKPALPPRGPPRIRKQRTKGVKESGGVSPEEALRRVRELKNAVGAPKEKAPSEMSELDKFEKCKAEVMAKKKQASEEKLAAAEAEESPAINLGETLEDGGSPAGSSEKEEPWFVKVRSLPPSSPVAGEVSAAEREKKLIGIVLQERYKGSSGNSDIFGDAEDSDKEDVFKAPDVTPSPPQASIADDDDLDMDENEFLRLDYSDN